MKVKLSELKKLAHRAILNYGYSEKEAKSILDVMMYAQLRGNNQGVVKLIGPGIPKAPDAGKMKIAKQTKLSALIDGGKQHAMVAVNYAVDIALQKAKKQGIGLVGVNHLNTSSGAIGYYAKRIAQTGYIGLVFAGSPETVAAEGSYEAILGTNPLAMAIPTSKDPLVLDMATAAMAYFGVIEANTAGKSLPENIAYDKKGKLTTVPAKVLDGGALRTFDKSYKGYGLSLMVQILAGPLVGASYTGIGDIANNWSGHLILAIDPNLLGGLRAVKTGVTQMTQKVKATKKLPGAKEILVPSERGNRIMHKALTSGSIEIESNLFSELKKVSR